MKQKVNINKIISTLKKIDIVSKIEIITIDEIGERGVYRIRCNLIPSKYKLDIRFIQTEKEFIYSYQLFTDKPIFRWDNTPHYPDVKTFPHHFHNQKGDILESTLKGVVTYDLNMVFHSIEKILK